MNQLIRIFCFLFLWALPSTGWSYVIQKTNGHSIKWPQASLPVQWHMNMNGYTGVTTADAETAFKNAMSQWTSQACTSFSATYKGKTTTGYNRTDGVNVLLFGIPSGASDATSAKTFLWFNSSGEIKGADIVFSTKWDWSVNPNSTQLDLRATATHEIGHLLGLGHTSDKDATMYSLTTRGPSDRRTVEQDDIQGLCVQYPKNCTQDADCGTGNKCTNGACGPDNSCTTDTDCGAGKICDSGTCVASSSSTGKGALCGSAAGGKKCDSGFLCISLDKQPARCYESCQNTCPNGGVCSKTSTGEGFCNCVDNSECNSHQTCTNASCIDKAECTKDEDCAGGKACQQGKCVDNPAGCVSDADCPTDHVCVQTQCQPQSTKKGFGQTCQKDDECASNLCKGTTNQATSFCTVACPNTTCPSGYVCQSGHCQIETTETEHLDRRETTVEKPGTNEPSTTSEPQGNQDAGTNNETTQPSSGCGCQTTQPPPTAILLSALLLLLGIRRRS